MTEINPLVQEAQNRGYLTVKDERITYHCTRDYGANFRDPEEKNRAFTYSWLIIERSYSPKRINIEVTVPRRTPSDLADIVVYEDDGCTTPYLVVENKHPNVNVTEKRQAIEQGFGNANSLRCPYMLFDAGATSIFYDVAGFPPTERVTNVLGVRDSIPTSYGDISPFTLIANSESDIRSVTSKELETRVRRAHGMIWSGGKRDPLQSFDIWSRLLFAKIYDERRTPNGHPREFQVGSKETSTQVANRIRLLYNRARRNDPSVFSDDAIDLPDDKIQEVVFSIQHIGLTLMSVDALGHAFEHFFSSIFRGGLGQYFTRRELARFMVAAVEITDRDFVIDPTAGSGGFLLETLMQVWHFIDQQFSGRPDAERMKLDFAHQQLFGIEINESLGRVCKTNLILHKDGHTNIESNRSCLDGEFSNSNIDPKHPLFSVVLGNPPFGDQIKEGDRDVLGSGDLSQFQLGIGKNQVPSEILVIERSLQLLVPGGRLAMVVPDGLLNNPGESSLCPAFRRFILRNTRIDAIISLPDHAFRKSGAQNKTSIIIVSKLSEVHKSLIDSVVADKIPEVEIEHPKLSPIEIEVRAIAEALSEHPYAVFLAEADEIGYSSSGVGIKLNDLYSATEDQADLDDMSTILGRFIDFKRTGNSEAVMDADTAQVASAAIPIATIITAHPTHRLDPKFHLFNESRLRNPPEGMQELRLGDILKRRLERVDPPSQPDEYFLVPTLSQTGIMTEREPGGNNPLSWYGEYFSDGSHWFRTYSGDLVFSQIDLWKGCVTIVPEEFDNAIVSKEFPIYRIDAKQVHPAYLALLLRSSYFQRAIRAITTGHSNRRRTQTSDFENLRVYLPANIDTQEQIGSLVLERRRSISELNIETRSILKQFDSLVTGDLSPEDLLAAYSQAG